MALIGQFRVVDDPNRFVWLRGFANMETRAQALGAFYGGPVWKAHKDGANATMVDSDDVLLLRPARPNSGFELPRNGRDESAGKEPPGKLYVSNVYYFREPMNNDFVSLFEQVLRPAATRAGAVVRAYFVTEPSANNFPALPIRANENVFAWFGEFADLPAYDRYIAVLSRSADWQSAVRSFEAKLSAPVEVRRLTPTSRSRLR